MPNAAQLENFKLAVPAAQAAMQQFGVPASVTLAQWEYESSWGQSELARQANNYFGIKHVQKNAGEPYVEFQTAEFEAGKRVMVEAEFVRYVTMADSFKAHARLLAQSPRYAPAMALTADPLSFCHALQRCGYSTNPNYAQMLIDAISAGNLTQYDKLPPAAPALAQEAA